MSKEDIDVLPVVDEASSLEITGLLSYKDILAVYDRQMDDHIKKHPAVSLKRRSMKVLIHGKKLMDLKKSK